MSLSSEDEPVFFLQRRRWIDRHPVLLEFNALLASWCPGLLDADLNSSLTRVLRERFSRVQSRSELEMHIGTVNEDQAELLQLSPGSTSAYLERLNFGEEDQAVEFDQEFWRPDAQSIVMKTPYPGTI
jgi:DNA-binding GntR family transcriptional regulator